MSFKLNAPFSPAGDQPEAIRLLMDGVKSNYKYQTLLGVTGSGKTYTIANVIEQINKPILIISPNKTLAGQLYGEFKNFFPENAVEYFISYYDYYQPEAYVPQYDLYISKEADINKEIEKLRLKATASLLTRKDIIIVASVSCIYNIGSPDEFKKRVMYLKKGMIFERREIVENLVKMLYSRNDFNPEPGNFRVKGDTIEIYLAEKKAGIRIILFENKIEDIRAFDPLSRRTLEILEEIQIFPVRHFLIEERKISKAVKEIRKELKERVKALKKENRLVEAERLLSRTNYDIEMLLETGYCPGIENYTRYLSGKLPGERPFTLLDYFPKDYLVIIDESHITLPQLRGMYNGDRSRKETLVKHGFRLPSALDNRPLKFSEIEALLPQVIFVSATPGDYELSHSEKIVELIVRPTGLIDPPIEIRPVENQIEDLLGEIQKLVKNDERVLITTLTKKMAEDLSFYLSSIGVKVKYLHSDIDAIERVKILRELRLGNFDVLVGINLLREGLDLPEVSLVAILDADKEGFLRDERSIIQTAGRTARNANGRVILYASKMTKSIKAAISETDRRRKKQIEYNKKNNIVPRTIKKSKEEILQATSIADSNRNTKNEYEINDIKLPTSKLEIIELIEHLRNDMKKAAKVMEFEKAALIRDKIRELSEYLEVK